MATNIYDMPGAWFLGLFGAMCQTDVANFRASCTSLLSTSQCVFTSDFVDHRIQTDFQHLEDHIVRACKQRNIVILRRILQHPKVVQYREQRASRYSRMMRYVIMNAVDFNILHVDILDVLITVGFAKPTPGILNLAIQYNESSCMMYLINALQISSESLKRRLLKYDAVRYMKLLPECTIEEALVVSAFKIANQLLTVRLAKCSTACLWQTWYSGYEPPLKSDHVEFVLRHGVVDAESLVKLLEQMSGKHLCRIIGKVVERYPAYLRTERMLLRLMLEDDGYLEDVPMHTLVTLLRIDNTYTPYHMSALLDRFARMGCEFAVDLLIARGAKLPNNYWAMRKGSVFSSRMIYTFVEAGADPSFFDDLKALLVRGDYRLLAFMLRRGAPVSRTFLWAWIETYFNRREWCSDEVIYTHGLELDEALLLVQETLDQICLSPDTLQWAMTRSVESLTYTSVASMEWLVKMGATFTAYHKQAVQTKGDHRLIEWAATHASE